MKLNTNPENRKDMAKAISELLGEQVVYQGVPSCTYTVGTVTVNRDGTIDSEDTETITRIKPMLIERGWLAEEEPDAEETNVVSIITEGEPITLTDINMPIEGITVQALKNLLRMLYSRQELINRMLRMDRLAIDDEVISLLNDSPITTLEALRTLMDGETEVGMLRGVTLGSTHMTFALPYEPEAPEKWYNYGKLLTALFNLASTAARVKTEKLPLNGENEKYYANAWLNRLGFGGPEHKEMRHNLMDHLSGFAAFKDGDRMQAHKEKYAAIREARRDSEAEGGTDAQRNGNDD